MWAPGAYLPDRSEGDGGAREHRRREVLLRRRRPDPQPDQGGPQHGRSCRSAPARSPTCSIRRPATAPTSTGTTATSSRTASRRAPTASRPTVLNAPAAAGATGIRVAEPQLVGPGDQIVIDYGTPNAETRSVAQVINPNPPSPAANIMLTEPLALAHAAGAPVCGRDLAGRRRLPAAVRDGGQVRGARVRGGQLRPARVGVRLRTRHDAAAGADDQHRHVARAGRDDVRVRQRAGGDPLHDWTGRGRRSSRRSGTPPARASRARCSTSTRRRRSGGARRTSRATSSYGRATFRIRPARN